MHSLADSREIMMCSNLLLRAMPLMFGRTAPTMIFRGLDLVADNAKDGHARERKESIWLRFFKRLLGFIHFTGVRVNCLNVALAGP